jgi:ribosome-associated translation inhibitor RaiA
MTLEFRGVEISGIQRDPVLRAHVKRQVGAALSLLKVKPVSAQVSFFDDNGPKGGMAMRCAMTVRLPYRPSVRVEHTAETERLAFDGGFATLERLLERYRERDRDNRRHPKKYFVAKRLIESAPVPRVRGPRKTG